MEAEEARKITLKKQKEREKLMKPKIDEAFQVVLGQILTQANAGVECGTFEIDELLLEGVKRLLEEKGYTVDNLYYRLGCNSCICVSW